MSRRFSFSELYRRRGHPGALVAIIRIMSSCVAVAVVGCSDSSPCQERHYLVISRPSRNVLSNGV